MLIPAQAKIAALIVSHLLVGWAAWEWRDRSADATDAQRQAEVSAAQVQQLVSARAQESRQAETMATIGAKHEEDRAAAEAVPDAVVADLRAGVLRLRDDLATCHTAGLSQAVAGAVERDAHAQLRGEVAGAVVQVGRDADNHVTVCQAVVRADRE